MARDPLQVLLRLRGIGLDAARRALAERLRAEAAAAEQCAGIEAGIAAETAAQRNQPPERRTLDAYAAWLGNARGAQRAAQAATRACEAATAAARASLHEARAGTRALEAALTQAQELREGAAARQEQQAVDEAAALCPRAERWSG